MGDESIRGKKFVAEIKDVYGKIREVPYQIVGIDEEGLNVFCVRVKYLVDKPEDISGMSQFPDGSYVFVLSQHDNDLAYTEEHASS